jgi:Protein kinase domain
MIDIGVDFLGYRIDELVGRGGMGVVYRAYDLRLKRTVAVKLVNPQFELDARFRERFARETEVAMALEHPNVVPIHDAGDVDGRLYLAMRFVSGRDLRALLRTESPLPPARALAICGQVASALDAAHARGLVHRDVKPSNVLLDESEHVYLSDFGLSRRLDEPGALAESRPVGTPAYLAPEQIERKAVDGRADVYSLGCLLFECLTGHVPFTGSRLETVWAHLEAEPPKASALDPSLPQALDAVIGKALAKEPDDRYATCGALVAAARDALGLARPPDRRRRRLAVAGAAAILAAVIVALAVVLATRSPGARAGPPLVEKNSLVRIDPKTNAVTHVVSVGARPMAVAVGGHSVWVYNADGHTLSEVDARTKRVLQTTSVSNPPSDLSDLTGPILAADEAGAWLIGLGDRRRSLLTRVFSGGGKREYRLDREPRGIAIGPRAVWVIGRSIDDDQVLRVDPATGRVTARVRFQAPERIDSLDVGLGAVWVVASATATLYRIDPRTAVVTKQADIGTRAGRPDARFHQVWVGVSDEGGKTLAIDPAAVEPFATFHCCPLGNGYESAAGFGSSWANDIATGTMERFDPDRGRVRSVIHVTEPPFYGGLCLTSVAAGLGGVWATLAAPIDFACQR